MDAKPGAPAMEPACRLALEASFGSVECWREQFAACAGAPAGDAAWVLLLFLPNEGRLVNQAVADRALAAGVPIVSLDLRQQGDIGAFLDHVDWPAAYARYQEAVHAASEAFGVDAEDIGAQPLFDVRRAGVFEKSAAMLPGARWRDPAQVAQWAGELPPGAGAVVYCVYGHELGRATALRLRAAGIDARFLRGGFDGWQAAGRTLAPKGGG